MHVYEDYWNQPYQVPTLESVQNQQSGKDFALMTQKVVYPYEPMDSFERF